MENVVGTENKVIIHFDLAKYEMFYKKYFDFEWRRQTRKVPYRFIFVFSVMLVLIGWWQEWEILIGIGMILLVLISAFIGFYSLKYKLVRSRIMKSIAEKGHSGFPIEFSFDESGWSTKTEQINQKINWDYISYAVVNAGDLYFFAEEDQVVELIATSLIGEEKVKAMITILSSNGKLKG